MAYLTKKIYFLLTVLVIVVCLSVLHFEDRIFSMKSFRGYRPVLFYTRNSSEKTQISVLPMSSLLSVARSSFTSPVPSLSTTWLKNVSVLSACKPPGAHIYKISDNVTAREVQNKTALQAVQLGGRFEPKNCRPRDDVAIIVPYRNRTQHLEIFLNHLHNFLQRQMIKYDIYLIEPVLPLIFNRGLLCNIGFSEAISLHNYTCIIIHDVDQLPLNSENFYSCDINARHLATETSKNKYKLPYFSYIGGVLAVSREFYKKLNGFSNVFFGWGGEDDDFLMRVQILNNRQGIPRPAKGIGRYISLPHNRDKLNPENPKKLMLFKTSRTRFKQEGLNTVKYKVLTRESKPLYTWIQVSYNETYIMKEFNDRWNSDPKRLKQNHYLQMRPMHQIRYIHHS